MKKKNENFTVIIPTYFRIKLLKRAIKSIFVQKVKISEIIIVDDKPSIETYELVKKISKKSRIKIIYTENKSKNSPGAYSAKNYGISKYCKGNYIAFLDDDDYWNKNYLETVLKSFKSYKVQMTLCNYFKVYPLKIKKKPFEISKNLKIRDLLINNKGILQSNFAIEARLFKKLQGFDANLEASCDRDILLRAFILRYKYHQIKSKLVNYQIHDKNWSTEKGFNIIYSKIKFYIKHFKYFRYLDHYLFYKFLTKLFYIEIIKLFLIKS